MTRMYRWLTILLLLCVTSCGGGGGAAGDGSPAGGGDGAGNGDSVDTGSGSSDPGIVAGGGSGVGSGGTGISVGPISGFGSIFVNGVQYDVSGASVTLNDAASLQLGMTVEVRGTTSADFTTGTASTVVSSADLRGPVTSIDLALGTLEVLGTTVSTDEATVLDGVAAFANLVAGDPVQVYGLLDAAGSVRATRIEKLGLAGTPVVSGVVSGLNTGSSTFNLGALSVSYAAASFTGGMTAAQLANGVQVRVRSAAAPVAGVLLATQVQAWNGTVQANGAAVAVSGVVTNFSSLASMNVLGVPVDASNAQVTGGAAASVGNGVKVEVSGNMANGVLVAAKLKIKHVPGSGGPVSYDVAGTIGSYVSSASFRIQGNRIDASGGSVVFSGGTAADLGNGVKAAVVGSQVVNGILIADKVTFIP